MKTKPETAKAMKERHIVFDPYGSTVAAYGTEAEAYAEASRRNAVMMRERYAPRPQIGDTHGW